MEATHGSNTESGGNAYLRPLGRVVAGPIAKSAHSPTIAFGGDLESPLVNCYTEVMLQLTIKLLSIRRIHSNKYAI